MVKGETFALDEGSTLDSGYGYTSHTTARVKRSNRPSGALCAETQL